MNKTKAIALSAICSGMAIVCFVVGTYVELFGFVMSLLGGVIVCVPMIVTKSNRVYTLVALAVALVVTSLLATSRIVELVYYCTSIVPLVIIKAWCDRVTLDIWQEDANGNAMQQSPQRPLVVTKWVLYYIFMQISIASIIAVTYLLMPLEWEEIWSSYILIALVVLLEIVPIALDKLLNGIFPLVKKAMIKAKLTP